MQCPFFENREAFGGGHGQIFVAVLINDRLRGRDDVAAVVTVFRKFDRFTQEFTVTRIDRFGEIVDLVARVVDVVLRLCRVAGGAQQVDQRTAERRAAAVTDMERSGGIGADVFDLNIFVAFFRQIAVVVTFTQNFF